MPYS
ncbi:c4362a85-1182-4259-859b-e8bf13ef0603 [Thermothielavioides terrestris]